MRGKDEDGHGQHGYAASGHDHRRLARRLRAGLDGYQIAGSIEEAAAGLGDEVTRVTQLRAELEMTLFDKITSEQLDEAVIQVALQNVKDDPAFDTIASRLLVKTLYKRVFGEGVTRDEVDAFHGSALVSSILRGVDLGLLDVRLAELFDLEVLGAALDPRRDDLGAVAHRGAPAPPASRPLDRTSPPSQRLIARSTPRRV